MAFCKKQASESVIAHFAVYKITYTLLENFNIVKLSENLL